MSYILPKPLRLGDTIGVIAPSGPICEQDAIYRAKSFFETLGYQVVFSKHLFEQDRYLSAPDKARIEDIHWAFSNDEIDTIICARGGYGALRLINDIDYNLIKTNPKNFCGYSDITVLSAMFLKHANLITYSAPMMKGDFGAEKKDNFTMDSFFKAITNQPQTLVGEKIHKEGKAEGILWGGNLASIVSLAGTDFIPDEDIIFFAEDLNEPVYKIDKMLTQLMNIKQFRTNVKGIVFGEFLDVEYPDQLIMLFDNIGQELNIPVASGFKISHNKTKATVPYGAKCVFENDKVFLDFN